MRYADLAAWLERHEELERRWAELWCGLPESTAGLASLAAALRLHVAQEEATLLPAWERVPDPPPNATAAVLRRDHERLLRLLDELGAAATRVAEGDPMVDALWSGVPSSGRPTAWRRDAGPTRVERAGLAWTLREVLHHHDRREATSLKPGLDRVLDPATVRAWLDRFAAEEDALPPAWRCEPGGRTAPDGPTPEEAIAADALVTPTLAGVPVPDHPKGVRLHAHLVAGAAAVDATEDARARRTLAAELWGALRLVRIVSAPR